MKGVRVTNKAYIEDLDGLVGEHVRVTCPYTIITGPLEKIGTIGYRVHIQDRAPTVAEVSFDIYDIGALEIRDREGHKAHISLFKMLGD